jgi:AcrR family transcriptional regulator
MSSAVITIIAARGRWQPNAPGRLEQAALDLYGERGFEQTTVAEIAERAGLTERTFFRHYADKREVLFAGGTQFQQAIVGAAADAPVDVPPMEAVAAGLGAVATGFEERREFARRRAAIITSSPELRERELIKLASVSEALAATLRERGVAEPAATLTAEAGMAVFKVAFERWVTERGGPSLAERIQEALEQLTAVTAAR